jgi:hypothetical protein
LIKHFQELPEPLEGYNEAMFKLIILVESTTTPNFHVFWPRFLQAAENIPGLKRESTSRINQVLYGDLQCAMVHELYFDSYNALKAGLASESGKDAGRLLQEMTAGRVRLMIADHSQDELENIRKYKPKVQDAGYQAGRE